MFLRRNVGMSKSWPSTIVGSLFSKRPRVIGSNCITSCFAETNFSFGGFGSFASFSRTAFFFGGIKRGAGFLIEGAGIGGGGGGSNAINSLAVDGEVAGVSGSGTMSIFGAGGGGSSSTFSKIAGGGARNGSGIGDAVDEA